MSPEGQEVGVAEGEADDTADDLLGATIETAEVVAEARAEVMLTEEVFELLEGVADADELVEGIADGVALSEATWLLDACDVTTAEDAGAEDEGVAV